MKEIYVIEITEYGWRSFESSYIHENAFEDKKKAIEQIYKLGFSNIGYNNFIKDNGDRTFANLKLIKLY